MEYAFMHPPFEIKPFKEMSKKEAQNHFNWYIDDIPNRIVLLKNAYEFTSGKSKEELDYSPSSLIGLWKWYLNKVEIEEKSEEAKKLEGSQYPEWVLSKISNRKISLGWMAVAMDIVIYFSESFIKKHNSIHWGFVSKPKSLVYINKPVLVGFKTSLDLDSINIIKNLTLKIVNGERDPEALLKLFEIWSANV